MAKKKEPYYVTTPIYYINDVPHIGHAYCTIACDILTRYKKFCGYDTFFLTGSDENSQKTEEAAREKGKDIQEYTDEMAEIWKSSWEKLALTNDDFIRTTEERHKKAVLKLFKKIHAGGDIYKGKYEGHYCWKCEAFYKESDLIDGKNCPDHQTECEIIEEENYFFKLSKYEDQLLEHYKNHPDFVLPKYRKREVVSFIEGGLDDISVSRAGKEWGIPLPIDDGHVIYVWFDALINYISGIGYGTKKKLKYWPCDFHVLGKDIVRFHCVIWPAMLLSAGLELPKSLFVHGFFTINGSKISKSLGNAIAPVPIAEKFGRDALRYYLFAEFPFGQDGDFSFKSLLGRVNNDLADDLGNLLSRSVSMTLKFGGGKVQPGEADDELDRPLQDQALYVIENLDGWYSRLEYSKLLEQVWKYFRLANKYVEENKPWVLKKDETKKKRLDQVLYNLIEAIRLGSYFIRPILPETADKILGQLGLEWEKNFAKGLAWGKTPAGTEVSKGDALFPKIDLEEVAEFFEKTGEKVVLPDKGGKKSGQKQKKKKDKKKKEKKEAPKEKGTIEFEDFLKLDLKVGEIVEAEKVPKSKKLLKFQVDIGGEKRQVLSGISEHYEAEDMVGKKVVLVLNLAPRKIMGHESQGMILCASDGDDVIYLTPEKDAKAGSEVS